MNVEVQAGVDLVNAVAAKLGAPLERIWIVKWESKNGEGVILFRSQQGAINQMVTWLDEEWENDFAFSREEYERIRASLLDGTESDYNDGSNRWYGYHDEEVNP